MKRLILITIILLFAVPCFAAHRHLEKEYQAAWCAKAQGVQEYRLDDAARVDCLTDHHAIEFDFAPKWAESIGQALYYGIKTGKKPGVVLIIEGKGKEPFILRLRTVAEKYGIAVWFMDPGDLK
jgi:hypothetical protein